jgi:hypothetical protein
MHIYIYIVEESSRIRDMLWHLLIPLQKKAYRGESRRTIFYTVNEEIIRDIEVAWHPRHRLNPPPCRHGGGLPPAPRVACPAPYRAASGICFAPHATIVAHPSSTSYMQRYANHLKSGVPSWRTTTTVRPCGVPAPTPIPY